MARRNSLSQGKAGLPAAAERVRSGFREAAMPVDLSASRAMAARATQAAPSHAPLPPRDAARASAPVATSPALNAGASFGSGRGASMARRKAMSMGKAGLPAVTERRRTGFRSAALPADAPRTGQQVALSSEAASSARPSLPVPLEAVPEAIAGREAARRHRMIRAQIGRGDAASAAASAAARALPRLGELAYPAKVPAVKTAGGNVPVTGLSYAVGSAVTGAEAGFDKPLTGTQYVAGAEGNYRAAPGKVGHARTSGGQTVSGTMVRSTVRITGDEASSDRAITGNADQTLAEDLTRRGGGFGPVGTQFQRQSQPHGRSVHGAGFGRSARVLHTRPSAEQRSLEQTDGGQAVTGTAVGRSVRVTGGEAGTLRQLTGSQYLAPATNGTAARSAAAGRLDPVSGAKVAHSLTWGGQTVSGPQLEHDSRVTGSEPGSCAALTGTPYYGASAAQGWCDAETAAREAALRRARPARPVTGDVPLNDPAVTGTHAGAERSITGSPYFVAEAPAGSDAADDQASSSIKAFSVVSPQRTAHLAHRAGAADRGPAAAAITGSFARGGDRITGNCEFAGLSRRGKPGARPARSTVSGEGSVTGAAITGSAWSEHRRVTGTEGYIARTRNPSERAGSEHGFAGAVRFKPDAAKREASQKEKGLAVTGTVGFTSATGAPVTLSGGAKG